MTDKELSGFSLSISETDTYKKATGAHEFEVEGKLDFFRILSWDSERERDVGAGD